MNKKKRIRYAVFIFVCFLALIFFIANIVVTQEQFLYNTVCSVLGWPRRTLVSGDPSQYQYYTSDYSTKEETLSAANAFNEKIVEEGIVLLKNEDALPIPTPESDQSVSRKPKLSVFGHNSVNLVYGGSGSAGGDGSEGASTIYDSLQAAGYEYNPVLKSFYESSAAGEVRDTPTMGDNTLAGVRIGETPIGNYTDAVRQSYSEYSDAAVVVLSRVGGEGFDLPRTMKTSLTDSGEKVEGARSAEDHYLQLDENEVNMLREVMEHFDNIIIVINSSQTIELGFLDDPSHYLYTDGNWATSDQAQRQMDKIKGALWIGSPGKSGINALGRVMNGSVNPSGKTVDTYARDFTKDPTYNNFGTNNVLHGNEYYTINSKGNPMGREEYLVEYEEGIYVGYRYYETRYITEGENGDAWYQDNVVYPLGYGLSYTTFDWQLLNKEELENMAVTPESTFTVKVRVTNTGDVAGKDVVQVYVNPPYYDGGIEKSEVVLVGFAKTPLLPAAKDATADNPNWCDLEIEVKAEYFASYDYNDANTNEHTGYEIEHGDYELRVSRNAHDALDAAVVNVPEDIKMTEDVKTGATVQNRFDDVSGYIKKYMSRTDFDGTWPQSPTQDERIVTQEFLDSLTWDGNDAGEKWEATQMPEGGTGKSVQLYELIGKPYNDPLWEYLLYQLYIETIA